MHLPGLLVLLAAAAQPILDPEHTKLAKLRTTHSIPLVRQVRHRPFEWQEVAAFHAKYQKPIPIVARRASQTVYPSLHNVEHYTAVTIGNEVFSLQVDTGSADLWVFMGTWDSNPCVILSPPLKLYYPTSKSLCRKSWNVTYPGNYSARGIVFNDSVTIGGIAASSQQVQVAVTDPASIDNDAYVDGILGLGPDGANTCSPKCPTWITTVAPQLSSNLFTVNLGKFEGTNGYYPGMNNSINNGSVDFGFIDSAKYTGNITYTPVTSTYSTNASFWEYAATGYSVGNRTFVAKSFNPLVDTGTTWTYLDANIVKDYYSNVPGAKYGSVNSNPGWVFSCSTTLPNMYLYMASGKIVIPGKYINSTVNQNGTCFGGLQNYTGLPFIILGDSFLSALFVVFDRGNSSQGRAPQLGFASQIGALRHPLVP